MNKQELEIKGDAYYVTCPHCNRKIRVIVPKRLKPGDNIVYQNWGNGFHHPDNAGKGSYVSDQFSP